MLERGGGGYPPHVSYQKKIKFKNDKGFSFYFSFLFLLGDGGVSPSIWPFFKKQTSNFDFHAQTNFEVSHWLD